MKKAEILGYNDFLGTIRLSAEMSPETRRGIRQLHRAFRKLAKPILEDIDDTRAEIIGDKQAEVSEYLKKGVKDNPELQTLVDDFDEAYRRILAEDVDCELPKISPEAIYDVIPYSAKPGMPLAEIDANFERFYDE